MSSALSILILFLFPVAQALDLASHCASLTAPGECPCSVHQAATPSFCLSPSSPSTCEQRPCLARFVCDCAGSTLCRAVPVHSSLRCTGPLGADGSCKCARTALRAVPGSQPSTMLLPLRKFKPVHRIDHMFRTGANFCTERPDFWAGKEGRKVLDAHWQRIISSGRSAADDQIMERVMFRFGHPGHDVSFSSAATLSDALTRVVEEPQSVRGELVDVSSHRMNKLVSECSVAVVNVRLALHGFATRRGSAPPAFDVASRMVLQPCPYLPRTSPVVGMSVGRLLQRAMLATGDFPIDDAAISHQDATQACMAINRNFEGCDVDLGCVVVSS